MSHPTRKLLAVSAFVALIFAAFAGSPARAFDIQRVVSPGGITAWLVRDPSVPVISMSFTFRGGAAVDPAGKEGLADMVTALLDEGAGDLTSQEYQKALEEIAASVSFDAGLDRFSGSLRTLSAKRDRAFELLALALTSPRFDPDAVERIRTQTIVSLKEQSENPRRIAGRKWFHTVFPDHPYGRPVSGTVESVQSITIDDLKGFVHQRFARDNLIVGVAGDISPEDLMRQLDRVFGKLPAHAKDGSVADVVPAGKGRTLIVHMSIPQSVVVFGEQGVKRNDRDYYATFVMNHILGGGGFSSRLTEQVREKRGLVYGVYSYLNPMDHAGLIMGGLATKNATVAEAIKVVRAEWTRMAEKGVTANELEGAKTYINGSFPLRLDSTRNIAGILTAVQFSKLGIDYLNRRPKLIGAVTRKDIQRVAKRLLQSDKLTVVVVGDPKDFKGEIVSR